MRDTFAVIGLVGLFSVFLTACDRELSWLDQSDLLNSERYASYESCINAQLPSLSSEPAARRIGKKILECTLSEQESFYSALSRAYLNQQAETCNRLSRWSESCHSVISDCRQNEGECRTALEQFHKCTPYTTRSSQELITAGIETPVHLANSAVKLIGMAKACNQEKQYDEEKTPEIWQMMCNDFSAAAISFETVNRIYYDRMEPIERAYLLEGFSRSSQVVGWQATVASIIGIDAMTTSSHPIVRTAAAQVLEQHGDGSTPAMFALIQSMSDVDARVRAAAAKALRTQGNRKSLVIYVLLQALWDRDPEVRGNAALALREQMPNAACDPVAESRYGVTFPLCRPFVENLHPDPTHPDPNSKAYLDAHFPSSAGCGEVISTESQELSRVRNLEDLQRFSAKDNLCAMHVATDVSRAVDLARLVLFDVFQRESDVPTRAKMIASFRSLARGHELLMNTLRESLNEREYSVRTAALFALSRAAVGQMWLSQEIDERLERDPSSAVRKAAIAAINEMSPLSMKLEGKDATFDMYAAGVAEHRTHAQSCEDSKKSKPNPTLERNSFYVNGFAASAAFYEDFACNAQQSGTPVLLRAKPDLAEKGVWPQDLEFSFLGKIEQRMLQEKVRLIFRNESVPTTITHYSVVDANDKTVTNVKFRIDGHLLPGNFYSVTFEEGFATVAASGAYRYKQQILFKTKGEGTTDIVNRLMHEDPSEDVQYAAAESFAINNEFEVIAFLLANLESKNPDSVLRAVKTLSSPLVSLNSIRALPMEERIKFIKKIFESSQKFYSENSKLNISQPNLSSYRSIPGLIATQALFRWALEQRIIGNEDRDILVSELRLREFVLERLKKDFPHRSYTYYERIAYPQIRSEWIDLFDAHLLDRESESSALHLIYESLLKEDEYNDD